MNRLLFGLFVVLFLFAGCSFSSDDLPPEPPSPGSPPEDLFVVGDVVVSDVVGFVVDPVDYGYSYPISGFSRSPEVLSFSEGSSLFSVDVGVVDDVVYRYGYYLVDGDTSWNRFDLVGDRGSGNWLFADAAGSFAVSAASFGGAQVSDANYIIVFSCSRSGFGWDCHDNRWQLHYFEVRTEGCECVLEGGCVALGSSGNDGVNEYLCTVDGLVDLPGDPSDPGGFDVGSDVVDVGSGDGSVGVVTDPSVGSGVWLAEYYDGRDFDSFVFSERVDEVVGQWSSGVSPGVGIDHAGFSIRYSGEFALSGDVTFTGRSDDGLRVFVDGDLVIDSWVERHAATDVYSASFVGGAGSGVDGKYEVVVEFFETVGAGELSFSFESSDSSVGSGSSGSDSTGGSSESTGSSGSNDNGAEVVDSSVWTAQYYTGRDFDNFVTSREEETISFNSNSGGPAPGVPVTDFSAVWTGEFDLDGEVTFSTKVDDGIRVYVDDVLVLNQWKVQGATSYSATKNYASGDGSGTNGKNIVRVEYFQGIGPGSLEFSFTSSDSSTSGSSSGSDSATSGGSQNVDPIEYVSSGEFGSREHVITDDHQDLSCSACDVYYTSDTKFNWQYDVDFNEPGGLLCFKGGTYDRISVKNINGAPDNPVKIRNCEGQVSVKTSANGGFLLDYVRHIDLAGIGSKDHLYGFKIDTSNGEGMKIRTFSSDIEISYVNVVNAGSTGFKMKPEYSGSNPQDFQRAIMKNLKVHHTRVDRAGSMEGYYIGNTGCESGSNNPSNYYGRDAWLENIEFYDNIVIDAGADGAQFACAKGTTDVYRNTILSAGKRTFGGRTDQDHGIQLGPDLKFARAYDNLIMNTDNTAFHINPHGTGNRIEVYNNKMVNVPSAAYLNQRIQTPYKADYVLFNNNILEDSFSGTHAFRVAKNARNADNGEMKNNRFIGLGPVLKVGIDGGETNNAVDALNFDFENNVFE